MNEQISILESMRKKALHGRIAVGAVIIGGFLFAVVTRNLFLIFPAVIAGIVVYVLFARKSTKEYKDYYKNVFVRQMIQNVIPGAIYEPAQGFPRQMISATGLMQMGNVYHSEDYIKGVYNGVEFERADMLIQNETTDSEGNTSTTTYLRGRWMVFESNKTFSADLQIIQKGFGYANKRKGWFTRKENRRHEIKTEDESFNKQFQSLCQDDVEAFYLLTPGVMQAMMRLAASMDGKVMIGFVDNRIHVAVNSSKDSLEAPVTRSFRNSDFEDVTREINAITTFVENLNLDRKIFQ